MGTVTVITSGKGGTGKTTSTAAIASCLAALGHKTLCLDCDVGLKNLDLSLGLADLAVMDFSDVISGHVELIDAVTAHPAIDNLFFLSAPSYISPESISVSDMCLIMEQIRGEYEYCLIDSPAGLGAGFRLASSCADSAIVVSTGDAASLRDGQRTVAELLSLGMKDIRLLVNRVRPKLFRRICATVDDIIDAVGARLIGIVLEDDDVIIAGCLEKPLVLYSSGAAARQYLAVAKRMAGKDIPLGKF
jgi:septum site-determining protein MinD